MEVSYDVKWYIMLRLDLSTLKQFSEIDDDTKGIYDRESFWIQKAQYNKMKTSSKAEYSTWKEFYYTNMLFDRTLPLITEATNEDEKIDGMIVFIGKFIDPDYAYLFSSKYCKFSRRIRKVFSDSIKTLEARHNRGVYIDLLRFEKLNASFNKLLLTYPQLKSFE